MFEKKWEDSEFNRMVRIKNEQLEKIKKAKGQKTIAGKLDEIINYYFNGTPKRKTKAISTSQIKNNQREAVDFARIFDDIERREKRLPANKASSPWDDV